MEELRCHAPKRGTGRLHSLLHRHLHGLLLVLE